MISQPARARRTLSFFLNSTQWLRSEFDAVFKKFPSGLLVCALLVASGLMWAVMFFGPLAYLSRLAGGESPFDIRPMGYSYEEAYAFLRAIGERGRRYYANRELLLDMFYPPLYAISRGLARGG